ncbi:hypothetical protein [Xanthomonas medicagonis]|uniref:hypothetical protein n=1 Tax=Xanthomonas medicagonis TaxID=3160841 RepID=UPI00351857BE
MDIERLLDLLGHTSASPALMDFLATNGIVQTPKGDCTTRIKNRDKTLSLEFGLTDSFNETALEPAVGAGWFAFESVDVHRRFGGTLPFGLSFAATPAALEAALGSPLEPCRGRVQTHYRAPYLVRVFFAGGKAPQIETFRFSLPDRYSLENLPIQWHGRRPAATRVPVSSPALPAMPAMELLEWLGVSPEHAGFDAWLRAHGAVERPHRASRADDAEAIRRARLSEIDEIERQSVALIYEDGAAYRRLFDTSAPAPEGDFVLQQVAFYAPGISGYAGYTPALPFALVFADAPAAVRAKLGPPRATRMLHGLLADLWVSRDWHVTVSYDAARTGIAIVHVRRPNLYDLRMIGALPCPPAAPSAVDLNVLGALLGKEIDDPAVRAALQPMGWSDAADALAADGGRVHDDLMRHGLRLDVARTRGKRLGILRGSAKHSARLIGIHVHRAGDLGRHGFQGALPFGLQFHFTPEQIVQCMQREPDTHGVTQDTGDFAWQMEGRRLHVVCSLIDWQLYRLSYTVNESA